MTYSASTLSVSGLAAVVLQVLRTFQNRRATTRLSALTDEQLKDIGLTRGDLGAAQRLNFLADPSVALSDFASERYLASQLDAFGQDDCRLNLCVIETNQKFAFPSLARGPKAAA